MAAIALATTAWTAVPQTQPGTVELSAVRFFRSGETTLIDGFCRVPFSIVTALKSGEGVYHLQLKVRDSAGTVLRSEGWDQTVGAAVLGVPGGSSVEHFAFAARHGASYQIEVTVRDSASGASSTAVADVSAFADRPVASDVLLTEQLREGAASDTVPRPGEIRKGHWFITSTTRPVLTPGSAKLFYYLEAYPASGGEVRTRAHVLTPSGKEIVASAPGSTAVGAGGGILAGGLDLTGLPPGNYDLRLDIASGDTSVSRTAPFTMAGFETQAAVSRVEQRSGEAAGAFSAMTDQQLDSLYAPLVYLQDASERGLWNGLSHEGKINYLRQFWAKRDPSPGTSANEAEAAFYQGVAIANRDFSEGGSSGVPGWRTDRGRVFLENGAPDDRMDRSSPSGTVRPYVVWKYTHGGRARKYVFMDQTGLGHYELIYTNDIHEVSRPNWQDILGPEATRDVLSF